MDRNPQKKKKSPKVAAKKTYQPAKHPGVKTKAVASSPEPSVPLSQKRIDSGPVLFDGSGGGRSEAGWHSISDIFRCPKAYQFKEVRKLKKPISGTPDHFAIGSLFHAARARWFVRKFDTSTATMESIREAVEQEAELAQLPVSNDAVRRTMEIANLYVEHWSKRPLPRPVVAEYKLGPSPFREGDPFFLHRTARLDDASYYAETGELLAVGESKTTAGDISTVINEYTLHGQTLLQLCLWKMAPQGEAKHGKVSGVLLDVVKKPYAREKADFKRAFIPVSESVLSWYRVMLGAKLKEAAVIDWDSDVMRNIQGCTFAAGRARVTCEFRELCMFGRNSSGMYVMENGERASTWKPSPGKTVPPWQ